MLTLPFKCFVCLLVFAFSGVAQQSVSYGRVADSLIKVVKTGKEDTNKVNALNRLSKRFYNHESFDTSRFYSTRALALANSLKFKRGTAAAYNCLGVAYFKQGNYAESLKNYFASLKIREELNDKVNMAYLYIGIGGAYFFQKNNKEALTYYNLAMKIKEELGDKVGLAWCYNNIGNIYISQANYTEGLKSNFAALKIREEVGDKEGIGASYSNIGTIYSDQSAATKDPVEKEKLLRESLKQYQKCLDIMNTLGNKQAIATTLTNMGSVYYDLKKYKEAQEYCEKALDLAKKSGVLDIIKESDINLSNVYTAQASLATGSPKKQAELYRLALEHYKAYVSERDSLINEETTQKSLEQRIQYDYDKKEAKARVESEAKAAIARAESRKQKIIIGLVSVGLLLVLILAVVILRSLRLNQKQNTIINLQKAAVELQKELVEVKHKEISDSINYAERIQRSLLASKELLAAHLSARHGQNQEGYFVFFQPKATVSGDFYWAGILSNGNFALLTADSTGHGVPGAIMSVLNISCIEKAIEVEKLIEPAEILNHTRTRIIETLKKDGSEEGGKDGMDCSIISFDFVRNQFVYAAANSQIWIVRENKLHEFAPDKMPVGKHDKDSISFTQHTVQIQTGDMIYTLTDGMADQFGGPNRKKFMYKQLKELLLNVAHLAVNEQKIIIGDTINKWKADLEQVDDITIIGIRV
ncbi:MAG: tetratricopeptide repeat protein [Bacteroidetes bacterium]|nr:tetratricopeptide repeat protein [Bacteroidota bacterium]